TGEDNALCGESIEPRAGDVAVAVGAEIPAEVVPMHEQHVVSSRRHRPSFLPSLHRTVPMGIRQPFGSRRATYPQTRIHPQVVLAAGRLATKSNPSCKYIRAGIGAR